MSLSRSSTAIDCVHPIHTVGAFELPCLLSYIYSDWTVKRTEM